MVDETIQTLVGNVQAGRREPRRVVLDCALSQEALGLDEKWAYNAVKSVGNYGQIFERNVGTNSPLKLDRGLNDLWTRGGLLYAIPIR